MQQEQLQIKNSLQGVPERTLKIERHFGGQTETNLFMGSFKTRTDGKGKMTAYQVFPGVQLSLNDYLAEEAAFRHDSHSQILEINHCHLGRIGWNLRGGISVYLGPGDLSLHSMECCADSAMMFPLGYCEGISISINLDKLKSHPLPILTEASVNIDELGSRFCLPDKSAALPASPDIDRIFRPLYGLPDTLRLPYFKLKVQELLLYLHRLKPDSEGLAHYPSAQTIMAKDVHALLTGHLERRFTIEELSKKFLINSSSLKQSFKGVYGLPIAAYMKEYRIKKSMELLRNTDDSISQIAGAVGYGTQGKFTKAFKDIVKITPTDYRKHCRKQ